MILPAAVAVVGMVVAGGRWAHRLGWAVIAATGILALTLPVTPAWIVALIVSVLAAGAMVPTGAKMRKLPAATGPPDRAVLVPLVLIGSTFLVGIVGTEPAWAALVVGLGSPLVALLYSRVVFGGLLMVRLIWPLAILVISVFMSWPGWLVSAAIAVALAALARDPSVKAAFHPAREVGSTFPIPAELTPKDILEAARLDDKGRRK